MFGKIVVDMTTGFVVVCFIKEGIVFLTDDGTVFLADDGAVVLTDVEGTVFLIDDGAIVLIDVEGTVFLTEDGTIVLTGDCLLELMFFIMKKNKIIIFISIISKLI